MATRHPAELPPVGLEVAFGGEPAHPVLALSGELDLAGLPLLEAELARHEHGAEALVIDLSALAFADATGARALLRASRRAERDGRRLEIHGARPPVERVFELTGMAALRALAL